MLPLRAALLAVLVTVSPVRAAASGVVRIATEGAHPPFNYVEDGVAAGFEVELGRALCAAAKLTCTFVLHQWDGIIKGLEAHEYDAIMASLAITPRREQRIAFTRAYYRVPTSLMAGNEAVFPAAPADALRGRTVGVVEGSAAETWLVTRFPSAVARVFASTADAGLDLGIGRLDLVLADKLSVTTFLKSPEGAACCRLLADVPPGDPLLGAGIGVGVRKEDAALRAALDAALVAVTADGTYDRIRAKYLAFDTK